MFAQSPLHGRCRRAHKPSWPRTSNGQRTARVGAAWGGVEARCRGQTGGRPGQALRALGVLWLACSECLAGSVRGVGSSPGRSATPYPRVLRATAGSGRTATAGSQSAAAGQSYDKMRTILRRIKRSRFQRDRRTGGCGAPFTVGSDDER